MGQRGRRVRRADGFDRIEKRGRSRGRARSKSASWARASTPAPNQPPYGFKWHCYGCRDRGITTVNIGHLKCKVCKCDPPRAAYELRYLQSRGNGQQGNQQGNSDYNKLRAQIERLEKEVAKKDKEVAKKDVELAKQTEEIEAAAAAGGMEVDAGDGREDVRAALGKQRIAVLDLERVYKNCPSPPLAAALADARASQQVLQGKLVDGRTLEENLRVVGLNVARREKAATRIKEDSVELQDQIGKLQAKMDALQAEYTAKVAELERDKAERARLLARQATEAAASLPAVAAPPAAPAAAAPTAPQALFNAVAALPGFSEAHLQVLRGIWDTLPLQPRPPAEMPVPTSPVLAAAVPPAAVVAEAPANVEVPAAITADGGPAGEAAGTGAAVAAAPTPAATTGVVEGGAAAAVVDDLLAEAMDDGVPTPTPTAAAPSGGGANTWLAALDEERAAKTRRKKM